MWVCGSKTASLHLGGVLVPIWQQVGWTQPGLCWLFVFLPRGCAARRFVAWVQRWVNVQVQGIPQLKGRLKGSIRGYPVMLREMTWVWMGSWAESCRAVLCENIPMRVSVALSLLKRPSTQRMFSLGHSDPCSSLRCCKCLLSLVQGRVLMRVGKKCPSSSVAWGSLELEVKKNQFLQVSVFLVSLCFSVCLFLVCRWCTEILLCNLHSKWRF